MLLWRNGGAGQGATGVQGTAGAPGLQGNQGAPGIQGATGVSAPFKSLIAIDAVTFPAFQFKSVPATVDLTLPGTVLAFTPGQQVVGRLIPNIEFNLTSDNCIELTRGLAPGTRNWFVETQANALGDLIVTVYQPA